jgi:drug/metabolite transporter (DMT)-like permease
MKPAFHRTMAYSCLALSMALVGSYVALSKPLVAVLPVFLLAWLRFGIGALAMLHWLPKPAGEPPLAASTKRLLLLESLLGNVLFSVFMLYGVSMSSAVSAGMIMASIPAVVTLMSGVFLRERISPRLGLALACSALGMGLLALYQPEQPVPQGRGWDAHFSDPNERLGNLLVFAAVLCEAAYAVIGKKLTQVMGPKRIASLINLWGFALMSPLGLYVALQFDFGAVQLSTWGLLLFYALAASVWTVWLWMTGLKAVPAAHSGVFTVMLPMSATLVGVGVLGEPLSGVQGVAFAMALLGVVLVTLPGRAPVRPDGSR